MVELFAIGCFARMPTLVIEPVPPVTRSRTPHASRVKRASQPGSLGRDLQASRLLTRFEPSRPHVPKRETKGMSLSPTFVDSGEYVYGIEPWDYSDFASSPIQREHEARISPRSLPRTGRATLMASGSTSHRLGRLRTCPLSRLVAGIRVPMTIEWRLQRMSINRRRVALIP